MTTLATTSAMFLTQGRVLLVTSFQSIRPWNEFCKISLMKPPASLGAATKRVERNTTYFLTNYLLIVFLLGIYCLVTSPGLLFALIFIMMGAAAILYFADKPPIVVAGKQLTTKDQAMVLSGVSVPLLFFAGAGAVVFWLLGFSACVVLGHAAMLNTDEMDLPLEYVKSDGVHSMA